MKKFKRYYSGPNSIEFWKAVNSVKKDVGVDLYLIGCLLQDIEGRMFQFLEKAYSNRKSKCLILYVVIKLRSELLIRLEI